MKIQIYIILFIFNILIFHDEGVYSLKCFQFDGIYGCGDKMIDEPTECRDEKKVCSFFFLDVDWPKVRDRYYETEGCFRRQRTTINENNGTTPPVVEFVYRQSVKALRCKSLQRYFNPISYCCCQSTNNGCNLADAINDH